MHERTSTQYFKSLAQEFARAAEFGRGEKIVLEFQGSRETVPALDVSPFAAKTAEASGAAQAGDFKGAIAATQELLGMLQQEILWLWDMERTTADGEVALEARQEIFKGFKSLAEDALGALEQDAERDLRARVNADPAALLRVAQQTARYPRQLGCEDIMALVIAAASNLVQQNEKMQAMAGEIESLKEQLAEKEKPPFKLEKKHITPTPPI